jgi:hypothetical protein
MRVLLLSTAAVLGWTAAFPFVCPAQDSPALTREQMEEFLRTAEVLKFKQTSKGVTGTMQATLMDKTTGFKHDACIQCIDEKKPLFQGDKGTELNFRDTYKHNIAAYKLALMLGLDMVPPTVERRWGGKTCSFVWWVDDLLMDEGDRAKRKITPPDDHYWKCQLSIVHVFDELIHNVDRNVGNILFTKTWRLWMIDHSRAFRLLPTLRNPGNLKMCERSLLARMKLLDEETLKKEMRPYMADGEIKALLKRRDVIVKFFEDKGDSALYTFAAAQ